APGVAGAAPPGRTALPGSTPAWARAAAARGSTATGDHVGFRVYLGWRGGDIAARLATAVSTPGSAGYGRFLTAAQVRQRFAPSQADTGAVQRWLRDSGFTVGYTPANNHYVAAEGTVAQANAAFGITLTNYAVVGLTLRAPDRALSVPADLASTVDSVVGLD